MNSHKEMYNEVTENTLLEINANIVGVIGIQNNQNNDANNDNSSDNNEEDLQQDVGTKLAA